MAWALRGLQISQEGQVVPVVWAVLATCRSYRVASERMQVITTTWDDGSTEPVAGPPADNSALFDAIRAGNIDPILDHVQSNGDVGVVDGAGNTLLHWAALLAKPSLVSSLVDRGVDTNAINDRGVTALFYASMIGEGSVVSTLVTQGARVNLTGTAKPVSDDPSHSIQHPDHKAMINLELEPELRLCSTPIHAATIQGHFRVVLFLVSDPRSALPAPWLG
jgi:ankyrin repeat protein